MKRSLWSLGIVGVLLFAVPAFAGTELAWKANTEPDMALYNVYVCKVKGCVAIDAGPLWVGQVPHVAGVSEYTFLLPVNMEGAAVVTAQDKSNNRSVPSNMVSFSTILDLPPAAPLGLIFRRPCSAFRII